MVCEICGSKNRLVQDHNHITNKNRGILCTSCNTKLGIYEKHLSRGYGLEKPWGNVVEYLLKWGIEKREWTNTNASVNNDIKFIRMPKQW